MQYKYLDNINSPADLKRLQVDELPAVCTELRDFIIRSLSKNPGHLGSSLGAIELTVALHYVFDTPADKLVWDVGHQAYAHKILTGRRDRFCTNRQFGGLAPFPSPMESEYDSFIAGHASNSLSAALGMAIADGDKNRVVAIIGDGAMTGGLAYEGLNNVSMTKNNLLIILNDNNMAIDPIKGGMTQYLVDITTSERYNRRRYKLYLLMRRLGLMSDTRKEKVQRFNNNLKSILTKQQLNIFSGFNIRYFGPADGHDVVTLVKILREIKDYKGPKVLHLITKKGKGYAPAEEDQTIWHAPGVFNPDTGERQTSDPLNNTPLWQDVFGNKLLELAQANDRVVGITPAMPTGCSMNIMQRVMPERVFDVGIAEGHAVTFSGGLAKEGLIPVCNIYSSFLQRSFDNIVHDVALPNLHVVFCIDRAGIVGQDGATHHGLLDLCMLLPVPNITILAPMGASELKEMLRWAVEEATGPVAIRYPRGQVPRSTEDELVLNISERSVVKHSCASYETQECLATTKTANNNSGERLRTSGDRDSILKARCIKEGEEVAVLCFGAIGHAVLKAAEDTNIAVYDMRAAKPLDTELLDYVAQHFSTIFTAEDGMIEGGAGSAVISYLAEQGYKGTVKRIGVNNQFVEHGKPDELYHLLKLDAEGIRSTIVENVSESFKWRTSPNVRFENVRRHSPLFGYNDSDK